MDDCSSTNSFFNARNWAGIASFFFKSTRRDTNCSSTLINLLDWWFQSACITWKPALTVSCIRMFRNLACVLGRRSDMLEGQHLDVAVVGTEKFQLHPWVALGPLAW